MMSSTWLTETREPPPILYTRPGTPRVPAAAVAAAASATKVKSRVCSPSPYKRDRLPRHGRAEESVKGHVGPLPGSVDREVSQRDARDAVVGVVQVAQVFGGKLGDAVRRQRRRQGRLRHRQRRILAVDRGARRVHQLLDAAADARLEQDLRRLDVVRRVDLEVASPALPHTGLRGQVEHVGRRRRAGGRGGRWIVDSMNCEPRALSQRGEIGFLHLPRVVVGEAVDPRHPRALVEQAACQRGPDEPRDPGNQRVHSNSLLSDGGSRRGRPSGSIATVFCEAARGRFSRAGGHDVVIEADPRG